MIIVYGEGLLSVLGVFYTLLCVTLWYAELSSEQIVDLNG
jgi:hypothetical protein